MKKLLLSIVLLTGTVMAWAGTPNAVSAEKSMYATIKSQIRYPGFLKDMEGEQTAAIFFKISDKGNISVQKVECGDKDLKQNLTSQMEDIQVSAAGLNTHNTYKLVIKFESL